MPWELTPRIPTPTADVHGLLPLPTDLPHRRVQLGNLEAEHGAMGAQVLRLITALDERDLEAIVSRYEHEEIHFREYFPRSMGLQIFDHPSPAFTRRMLQALFAAGSAPVVQGFVPFESDGMVWHQPSESMVPQQCVDLFVSGFQGVVPPPTETDFEGTPISPTREPLDIDVAVFGYCARGNGEWDLEGWYYGHYHKMLGYFGPYLLADQEPEELFHAVRP